MLLKPFKMLTIGLRVEIWGSRNTQGRVPVRQNETSIWISTKTCTKLKNCPTYSRAKYEWPPGPITASGRQRIFFTFFSIAILRFLIKKFKLCDSAREFLRLAVIFRQSTSVRIARDRHRHSSLSQFQCQLAFMRTNHRKTRFRWNFLLVVRGDLSKDFHALRN